jgi:hypothetical protein
LLGLWWRIAWVFYVLITDSNNAGNFSGGVATFFSGFGLLGCHVFCPVKEGDTPRGVISELSACFYCESSVSIANSLVENGGST